jgi:hypothetical protein
VAEIVARAIRGERLPNVVNGVESHGFSSSQGQ